MPLETPPDNANEVIDLARHDVQSELRESNPWLRGSWLAGMVSSISERVFDFYHQLRRTALELMPDTAVDNLGRWGRIYKVLVSAGSSATGWAMVVADLPVQTIFPRPGGGDNYFTRSDGRRYVQVDGDPSSGNQAGPNVTSLTRVGTTCTCVVDDVIPWGSDAPVSISGAVESAYNVNDAPCIVVNATTFTYEADSVPSASPATGSPACGIGNTWGGAKFAARVRITDAETGEDGNVEPGTVLSFESPLSSFESDFKAGYEGPDGGTDIETTERHRNRVLDRIQNPVANFNDDDIRAHILATVPTVTRVKVHRATPAAGRVTIVPLVDDASGDPTPSAGVIAQVTDNVHGVAGSINGIVPAHVALADVIITTVTSVAIPVTLSAMVPNTAEMQAAVNAALLQFFAESVEPGDAIEVEVISGVVYSAVDDNGGRLTSFTMTAPAIDVAVADSDVAILGTLTMPALP